ncbi:MAG TPA: hypothetical protein VN493_06150 [Thermoanaerobaculia bacterium]|nr:hypothetical protein [Thermoanaerobaculia bacterium]
MVVLFDVLVIAAIAAGLLWGCGIPLARLLLPRRLQPLLPLVAPFLGLSLISALCHWAGSLGGTLRHLRWPVVAIAAAGWILILADRRLRSSPRGSAPALAAGLLAFLLAAVPLFKLGYLTTLGATVDGISYAVRSEYLQDALPFRNNLSPGKPWLGWVMGQIELIRLGDVQFTGLLGLLTGRRSYELLTAVAALFFALTSVAVFAWARTGLRLPRRAALFAALLAGSHNLLLWPVYDNFLSQAVATSLIPVVLAFAVEGQRRPDWRTAALAGVLLSALISIYPVYAAYTLAGVLAFWGVAWLSRPGLGRNLGRAALWWLGASACAAAWNGVALVRSVRELGFFSQVLDPDRIQSAGTGNILVFPPFIEVFGLVAHADAAYGGGLERNPLALLNVFGLGLAALALFGWWHLRPRARMAAAVLLLTGLALAAQQRWGINPPDGYPYGWYKSVSALAPQVVALLAAGLAALWRYRSKRWLAALAGLLLLGINVKCSLWTQSYVLEVRVPEDRVPVDRELIEAAQSASRLGPDDWLLLDLSSGLRPHWLGYLLRDHKVRYRDRLWIIHVETPGEAGAFFRYALVDLEERRGAAGEPWYDPGSYVRLWGNRRYELRMRRDSAMASTFWGRRWPQGEAVALAIAAGRGTPATAAVSLGAEARDLSLGAGTPRTVQMRVFSAGTGARLAVQGLGAPVDLPPGGWLVDLDLACAGAAGSGRFVVSHTEGDALLADVQVLGAVTGQAGACVETSPLPEGAAYVEQQILDGHRVRLDAVLLRPRGEQRVYRLSYHIGEEKGGQFGVWSLDFQPGTRVQRGTLELDLGDRSAAGAIDGRPTAPETCCFDKQARSFEGGIAWWRLHPTEQLRVEPMLWFLRSGSGSVEVSRSLPVARLEILPDITVTKPALPSPY